MTGTHWRRLHWILAIEVVVVIALIAWTASI